MNYLGKDNLELVIFFLGLKMEEFTCLQELVASIQAYLPQDIELVIMDQSVATQAEIRNPEVVDGKKIFRVSERFVREVPDFAYDLGLVQGYLDGLVQEHANIRVIRTQRRMFHSQCINHALRNVLSKRYSLLLDSDVEFLRPGFLDHMCSLFPETEWDRMSAAGPFAEAFHKIGKKRVCLECNGVVERIKRLFGRHAAPALQDGGPYLDVVYRLPRLMPHALLVNRELFNSAGLEFQLYWVDVRQQHGDGLGTYQMFGDCGSSLLVQSGLKGLSVGRFDETPWVRHKESRSYVGLTGKQLTKLFSK